MFRIGEFPRLGMVSVRMLRYYDETGLLKPRRVDAETGYRLYSAGQLQRLNRIVLLRDLGVGVARMAEVLDDWNEQGIAALLDERQQQIQQGIEQQRQKLRKLQHIREDLLKGDNLAVHSSVSIKQVPGQLCLCLRSLQPDYYAEGAQWKRMARLMDGHSHAPDGQPFTIYHDEEYKEKDIDMELCVPVAERVRIPGLECRDIQPVLRMASAMVYGSFENIDGAFRAIAGWLEGGQYTMSGGSRQIVHRGPWNEPDPDQYLTEIQIPLII